MLLRDINTPAIIARIAVIAMIFSFAPVECPPQLMLMLPLEA